MERKTSKRRSTRTSKQRFGCRVARPKSYPGQFDLMPGSFVRVEDTGAESITFGNARFRLISPFPRLQITTADGVAYLRWPTNAASYHLECTTDLTMPAFWSPIFVTPSIEGDQFSVAFPMFDDRKYFRLATP